MGAPKRRRGFICLLAAALLAAATLPVLASARAGAAGITPGAAAAGTASPLAQAQARERRLIAGMGEVTGGITLLDVADPAGDDHGPGTYQYPTAAGFHPGAFDLTRFQVINDGTTVYLRATLANLDPAFGSAMGARLLDVYVHAPGGGRASTQAASPSRNYTIAQAGAWQQRIEVQGFASPVWVDAAGHSLGAPAVLASQASRTITVALPAASFGNPGPGWAFTVVLTGQGRTGHDQARGFAATARPSLFGVCPPGGTAPVCPASPGSVPRAVDVITPPGVLQSAELDPTEGPVVLEPVPIPAASPGAALHALEMV